LATTYKILSFSLLNKIVVLGIFLCTFPSLSQSVDDKIDSLSKAVFSVPENKIDSLINIGNEILKRVETPEQKARLVGLLAVAHFEKKDLKKSTELLFEAKNIAETTGNHELIAQVYGSIAHQYIQLNLNDKAESYLNKAIARIDKLPDGNNKLLLKGLSYIELGNIASDNKNHLSANENYKKSLLQFEKIKDPNPQTVYHYRRALYNIGHSYTYLAQTEEAQEYLNRALRVKSNVNMDFKHFIYNSLAKVYNLNGEHQRSVDSLKVILSDGNFTNERLKSEVYLRISQNYKQLGNNEEYTFYNELYIKLNDSVQENDFKDINSAINTELQDYNSALSDADKNNRQLLMGGLFLLVCFLIVIAYLILKRRKEKVIFEKVVSGLKEKLASPKTEESFEVVKDGSSSLPYPVKEELLLKLREFEASEDFTNPKLNISTLAVQMHTNTTYLSGVINSYKGKNFNSYINDLRIEYICKKIYGNPNYLKYKISYLAEECGFASHSAFATVFKNVTGISPSVFLREATKKNSLI
jgi:AraC-like DNA-binding protein/lipopolysaccharide biosynthesis regulator YciM